MAKQFYLLLCVAIICSLTKHSNAQTQSVYQVSPSRAVDTRYSLNPAYFETHGDYLFYVSAPRGIDNLDVHPSYLPAVSLRRLDRKDNSEKVIIENLSTDFWLHRKPYALLNDKIIFFGKDGTYTTNFEGENKTKISDITHYSSTSAGAQSLIYNGHLYFSGAPEFSPRDDVGLWRTDGTSQGTQRIDLCEQACSINPTGFVIADKTLYFTTYLSRDRSVGSIWSLKGNQAPIKLLDDLEIDDAYSTLRLFPSPVGVHFFVREYDTNGYNRLWTSDGTIDGTVALEYRNTSYHLFQGDITTMGSNLIIGSEELVTISEHGKGTMVVQDLYPDPGSNPDPNSDEFHSNPRNFIKLNSKTYFIAYSATPSKGLKLWHTDGTVDGAKLVSDKFASGFNKVQLVAAMGDRLLIRAQAQANEAAEVLDQIWISKGTDHSTKKLSDTAFSQHALEHQGWSNFNEGFYFSGRTGKTGVEMWRTQGFESTTFQVKELAYGKSSVHPGVMAADGNDVYYGLTKYVNRPGEYHQRFTEVWRTDSQTMRSEQIWSWDTQYEFLDMIIPVEGGQFWTHHNEETNSNYPTLSFYDNKTKTATPLTQIRTSSCFNNSIRSLPKAVMGDKLFFAAPFTQPDGKTHCQLWVSDGTSDGTVVLTTIAPDLWTQHYFDMIAYEGTLYFTVNNLYSNEDNLRGALYKSDGTIEGTTLALRLPSDAIDAEKKLDNLTVTPSGLYFTTLGMIDGDAFGRIWKWHNEQLTLIHDGGHFYNQLLPLGEGVVFKQQLALWQTGPTATDTQLLLDVNRSISSLYTVNEHNSVIFAAKDDEGNNRSWIWTKGTEQAKPFGPTLTDIYFDLAAVIGNDIYITDHVDSPGSEYDDVIYRHSLDDDSTQLIWQNLKSRTYPFDRATANQRLFISGAKVNKPGTGGPYVTARLGTGDLDNDGVTDSEDALPLHYDEFLDNDHDGIGDNADSDDDNDGITDDADIFPFDATEWADNDNDQIGDTADTDDDNDGVADSEDAFPLDSSEWLDTDNDGQGNNADPDDDNDGVVDEEDELPLDPTQSQFKLFSELTFIDDNLANCVLSAANANGWTKVNQMQQLDCHAHAIKDLSAMRYLSQLTELLLSDNQIADISPLANLTALTHLDIRKNQLSDIASVAKLKALTQLKLAKNNITSLEPLAKLNALTFLSLSDNPIVDSELTALAELTDLTVLYLRDNRLSDISALAGLTNLTRLYLRNNQLIDISPLANLTQLNTLRLNNNQVSDINALFHLSQANHINLTGNNAIHCNDLTALKATLGSSVVIAPQSCDNSVELIADVVFGDANLRQCVMDAASENGWSTVAEVTQLDCHAQGIEQLNGLSTFTGLTTLLLSQNNIEGLMPLSNLTALTQLDLRQAQLNDISALTPLTLLTELKLSKNPINDISSLGNKTHLTFLSASQLLIDDSELNVLANLDNLQKLYLKDNAVVDISPLSGLTNLTRLYLHDNQISDLSPLSGLTHLDRLRLNNNQISDIAPLYQLTATSQINLFGNNDINCAELDALIATLSEGVVTRPASCKHKAPNFAHH